jgi:putative (di)nucleoside polyphosphate hydrolase
MTDAFFRANVGACVLDVHGCVLALKRKGVPEEVWQMPQGGIGINESKRDAVLRELQEETGLTSDDVEIVAEHSEWLVYELPKEYRNTKVGWGQVQKWFLLRVYQNSLIKPDGIEFEDCAWLSGDDLLRRTVTFRLPTYRRVLQEFAVIAATPSPDEISP